MCIASLSIKSEVNNKCYYIQMKQREFLLNIERIDVEWNYVNTTLAYKNFVNVINRHREAKQYYFTL